ncbi:MAG: helix-turn-helix domain-containing protein [Acidobacteria bacterium]|nr:helix-turn-helix domain-containing protein [Acidobacteriota bacterium]
MPTLGEELKRRREERAISLHDIAESTRIGIRFLKAIDADNYAVLPGGIFTRSFIRAYAKQVGMSEDEAMAMYNEQVGGIKAETNNLTDISQQLETHISQKNAEKAARAEKKKAEKKAALSLNQPVMQTASQAAPRANYQAPAMSVPKASTNINWGTLLLAAGILIVLGVIVTALVKQLNKASAEKQATNSPAIKVEPDPSNHPAPANPEASTQQANQPTASVTANPAPPNLAPSEALLVKIEATGGDSWIKFQADETPPTQMTIKQGTSQEVPPAQNSVKINYGNRTVLKLFINNKEAYFPAAAQKFKGLVVLSRDNLQTFFQPPPTQ